LLDRKISSCKEAPLFQLAATFFINGQMALNTRFIKISLLGLFFFITYKIPLHFIAKSLQPFLCSLNTLSCRIIHVPLDVSLYTCIKCFIAYRYMYYKCKLSLGKNLGLDFAIRKLRMNCKCRKLYMILLAWMCRRST
jgi:hypothetical protein